MTSHGIGATVDADEHHAHGVQAEIIFLLRGREHLLDMWELRFKLLTEENRVLAEWNRKYFAELHPKGKAGQ